ncbi:unnamed protein product [Angiostrongylus costaricensis]|uniref:Ribosome biogenesis protein SLX9 n=1 Tax=Angiostrongylus costaricensis TaxID=334426 RepID=A0A0R3PIB0_ANGCS|nr:unnamed protein product [Angiostrongylus costaricensis]
MVAEHFQTTLPKGVKQKVKKAKPVGPKRGHNLYIPPKKQHLMQKDKVAAEVSKIINEKNEEMVKNQANGAVGRSKAFNAEGEKPMDLIAHFTKQTTKQRQLMFDQVTSSSRIQCKSFLENRVSIATFHT